VDTHISNKRGIAPDGNKIYTLDDIYPHADLVTYPSIVEGFGNAFLEAVRHKKPIMVNNYSIYSYDIRPKGFKVIEMDNFISEGTVAQALESLENAELRRVMVEHNYRLGLKHYSYNVLEMHLRHILEGILAEVQ